MGRQANKAEIFHGSMVMLSANHDLLFQEHFMGEYCRIAPDVKMGQNVTLHAFVNLYGCSIGDNSRIGTFVEIQKNAYLGRNVKVSSHTFICEGVTLEDDVFIGHNVSFIN